jgi:hypothetical protein
MTFDNIQIDEDFIIKNQVENTPDSESILSSENIIVDNKLNTE